ncbi:hypothetical protein OCU04_010533 [Sclerotinia nivalis]|uniref:Fungal N-terminal domain-containing protein n=1 Tax=Sclerotinia nivalis TaxID=352851 RepID=A0A9X0AD45_9HELO|nr:hypothetical protein OCU04_010533 [Sclerotinia nivalis]
MALEVIGGIASIAQLAGTVYTISKTLYEVGEALSNAPSDIKDLARDLETFSDELHLLSTLLHGKDGRYADQVYRLTAKIIGDCATICTKIDRIIRKLRSGNMWAKVKWLYKEKEIVKLLARLRDLKLSLMGTLSVLSALRADHMMDSLGIQNSSLIGGQNGHDLSVETRKQVEDTRLKLAGMTMKDATQNCPASTTVFPSSVSLLSGSSSMALSSSATSGTYIGSAASRTPSTTSFAASAFISMATTPNSMPPILNSKALESVDSFHSAMSSQNEDGESLKIWRNEMALSAVKYFNIEKKDAEEWAMRLPVPSKIPATTATAEPLNLGENSPRPQVEDKPQEPCRDKVDADLEELASIVNFPASMGFAGLNMPGMGLSHAPNARKYGQLRTANNMHELGNDDEDSPSSQRPVDMGAQPQPSWLHFGAPPSNFPGKLQDPSDSHEVNASPSRIKPRDIQKELFGMPKSVPMDFQGKDEDDSFDKHSPTSLGYSPIDGDSPASEALQANAALTSSVEERERPNVSQFRDESTVDDSPLMDKQEGQEMKPVTSSKSTPTTTIKKASHNPFASDQDDLYGVAPEIESNPSKATEHGRKAQQQQPQIPPRLLPSQYPPPVHSNDEVIFSQSLHRNESMASYLSPYHTDTAATEQVEVQGQVYSQVQPGSGQNSRDASNTQGRNINTQIGNRNALTSPSQLPSLLDYQAQLTLLDDQNKRRLEMARQEQQAGRQQSLGSYPSNLANTAPQMNIRSDEHAQQYYQKQLMLLEEQNKERLMMAQQDQGDYQMQLMLLEGQNKERLMMAQQDQGDYQMQLMLLEGQNRKRLMMARLEQNQGDDQKQLMLLEKQNKKRLMMAQQEQHNQNLMLPPLTGHPQWQCQPPKSMTPHQVPATITSGGNIFDGIKNFSVDTNSIPLTPQTYQNSTAMPSRSSSLQMAQQGQASQLSSQPYQQLQMQRQQQMSQQSSHQFHEIQQSQRVQIQRQASQQSHTSVSQPYNQPPNLMRKSDKLMSLAAGHTEVISGPAPEEPKKNPSTQPIGRFLEREMAFFHHQNEASNQSLGGLWFRALKNVESFNHIICGNLQRLLAREDLFITSAAGSGPLVINPNWSANPRKERIAPHRQMFPRAASSIQRILDILGVMEETIGLKIGAIAWASLLSVVEVC